MNLPNKITVFRILLIPFFVLLMLSPLEWGALIFWDRIHIDTHFIGALIFILLLLRIGLMGILLGNIIWLLISGNFWILC